jgi:DNA-binding LacI/PurR family transcriptional regulator
MNLNPLETTLRPGEIVQHYIEREFLSNQTNLDFRLPTIERLAAHLQVSPSTVRNVVRRLSREGRLSTTQGKGTFISGSQPSGSAPLRLATNMTLFNESHSPNWSESIYLGAARKASTMPRGVSMMSITPRLNESSFESVRDDLMHRMGHIDLLMLFSMQGRHELRRAFQEAGKAVVDINPPDCNATSNFVSTDFFEVGLRIGRAWHASGRRRILYVTTPLENNISGQLLLSGLSLGCRRDEDPQMNVRVRLADGMTEDAGEKVMERVLNEKGELPDAVLGSGDTLTLGILKAATRRGCKLPAEMSIIGGTGLVGTRLNHPSLTLVLQPMEQIGATAVQMLCQRIDSQNSSIPGIFLPAGIHCGSTTRPEENALLQTDRLAEHSPGA